MHRTPRTVLTVLALMFAFVMIASPAFAQEDDPYTDDQGETPPDDGQGNQVIGETVTRTPAQNGNSGALALTGTESITLAIIGGGLVIGGAAFVTAGRRKGQASA